MAAKESLTLQPSTVQAGAGTYYSNGFVDVAHDAAVFFLSVSAMAATSATLTIQACDPSSRTWVDLPGASRGSISGVGTYTFDFAPGAVNVTDTRVGMARQSG